MWGAKRELAPLFITVPSNKTLEKGFEKILQATLLTSGYLCIINHFYI